MMPQRDAASAAAAEEAHERQRRGTRQLLLARGVFFASAYVVTAILTRALGPTEYGIYGVIVSLLLWLEMVVHAGVPAATSKLMADGRHEVHEVERAARGLLVGFSLVLLALGWLLAPGVAALMRIPHGDTLLRLAILDLPFAAVYASYEGVLYGRRRYGVLAVAQMAYALLRVLAVASLVTIGFTVEGAILALVASSVMVALLMLVRYPPPGMRPARGTITELIRFAAPMGVCLVAGQVLVNLDLWSLKSLWTGSGDVIGHYVASLNLARTLAIIPTVQAGVLFSSVAWAVASGDNVRAVRHIHEASRFALVIAGGASVVLGTNGAQVLSLLFSPAYAEGQRFLPLQLLGFSLFALLDVFANALMAAGRQRLVAAVLAAIVPVVWLGNYVLIPRVGPVGAAMSLVLGVATGVLVTGLLTRRHFGAVLGVGTALRVATASAAVALASAAVEVNGPLVLLKLVALGALYLLVLYVVGEISSQDLGLRAATPAARGR